MGMGACFEALDTSIVLGLTHINNLSYNVEE